MTDKTVSCVPVFRRVHYISLHLLHNTAVVIPVVQSFDSSFTTQQTVVMSYTIHDETQSSTGLVSTPLYNTRSSALRNTCITIRKRPSKTVDYRVNWSQILLPLSVYLLVGPFQAGETYSLCLNNKIEDTHLLKLQCLGMKCMSYLDCFLIEIQ